MKKRSVILVISLALASLACLSMAALDAVERDSVAPTMAAVERVGEDLTPTLSHAGEGEELSPMCALVVADTALNLRDGPSVDDSVLTWLSRGDVVELVSDLDPNWWRVRFEGFEGFARSIYLRDSECVK